MKYENLILNIEESIATLTLNRPRTLNALNPALKRELSAALDAIERESRLRGLIITGSGKGFCAGTDISEFPETVEEARRVTGYSQALLNRIEALEMPVIAAVNGAALGGGLEIMLCCDMRVAAEGAKLGFPEVKICAIPCYGGTQRLPRLIGEGRAREMIYTGRLIDSRQALAWGLVDRVVPGDKVLDVARELLREISANAPMAVRYAKQCITRGLNTGIAHGLDLERDLVSMLVAARDMREGVQSFLEKRSPVFEDR